MVTHLAGQNSLSFPRKVGFPIGTVFTSRIVYCSPDGLDTTVKSGSGLGRVLAPTWALVGGLKRWRGYEILTLHDYTERYYALLRLRYTADAQPFLAILAQEHGVLLCYCRSDDFCHRHLAIAILEKIARVKGVSLTRSGELSRD